MFISYDTNKMGRKKKKDTSAFTQEHVDNKDLVIQMLTYEDEFSKSDEGQEVYRREFSINKRTVEPMIAIHRIVLDHFGFDTSDSSVKNYRNIFRTYYKSPTEYDKDVMNASFYMKHNKCVFYKTPVISVGDTIPNMTILTREQKPVQVYDKLISELTLVAAFSTT